MNMFYGLWSWKLENMEQNIEYEQWTMEYEECYQGEQRLENKLQLQTVVWSVENEEYCAVYGVRIMENDLESGNGARRCGACL